MNLPVQTLIPQQQPFIMIGELIGCSAIAAITSYTIAPDNIMVTDGVFSEGGLLENMAQTAAAHAGSRAIAEQKPVQKGYIAAVRNFEVHRLPIAGMRIDTEVRIDDQAGEVTMVSGRIECAGELIATCRMTVVTAAE